MIEKLPWDSAFFNYPVGKITIDNFDIFESKQFTTEPKDYKLVYVFSKIELPHSLNLKLVDQKIIFIKQLHFNDNENIVNQFNIDTHSYDELLELTFISGLYSRFRTDQNFKNNEFSKLYKQWIDNSLSNPDIKIVVSTLNQKLTGFVTVDLNDTVLARIGLIAVDNSFQGKSIGSELLNAAENIASENGNKSIEVATQFANAPAMHFYKKNNYSILSSTYIYHIWN